MRTFPRRAGKEHAREAILLALILGLSVLFAGGLLGATPRATGGPGVPVHMTVTVVPGHNGQAAAAVAASDVAVSQGRAHDAIASWVPAQGSDANMQLLILIDDSSHSILSDQLADLRTFIQQQPATTEVGVGYMYNGLVHMAANFGSERAAAAKSLHPPIGTPGTASPYFSLMELVKQWRPDPAYPRREILLISDGSDPYAGGQIEDPYVEQAIADVQRAGIQVFSIFTPGADTRHGGYWGGTYLSMLSQATGGDALYMGYGSAVSFAPFLSSLNYMLNHQYLLTFNARQDRKGGLQKGGLQKVKVTSSVSAKLRAPTQVYIPGVED